MQNNFNEWENALNKLKAGNEKYIGARKSEGDISPEKRLSTYKSGQNPYAVIVACSDSRVIPESIFSAGIGELLVIRVAGNVVDDAALGSIEYAVEHLKVPLVVVLGHTCCGAVNASINGGAGGYIKMITDKIRSAIREERDDCAASRLNVGVRVSEIHAALSESCPNLKVLGAIYHIDTGIAEFLN